MTNKHILLKFLILFNDFNIYDNLVNVTVKDYICYYSNHQFISSEQDYAMDYTVEILCKMLNIPLDIFDDDYNVKYKSLVTFILNTKVGIESFKYFSNNLDNSLAFPVLILLGKEAYTYDENGQGYIIWEEADKIKIEINQSITNFYKCDKEKEMTITEYIKYLGTLKGDYIIKIGNSKNFNKPLIKESIYEDNNSKTYTIIYD